MPHPTVPATPRLTRGVLGQPAATCRPLCRPGVWPRAARGRNREEAPSTLPDTPTHPHAMCLLQKGQGRNINKGKCSPPCLCPFGRQTNPARGPQGWQTRLVWSGGWACGVHGSCAQNHSLVSSESSWLLKPGTLGLQGNWRAGQLGLPPDPGRKSTAAPQNHPGLGLSDLAAAPQLGFKRTGGKHLPQNRTNLSEVPRPPCSHNQPPRACKHLAPRHPAPLCRPPACGGTTGPCTHLPNTAAKGGKGCRRHFIICPFKFHLLPSTTQTSLPSERG